MSDQSHVWASQCEARLDDLFAIEKAIADTIGATLGIARRAATPPGANRPKTSRRSRCTGRAATTS